MGDLVFDSKREAARWVELLDELRAGRISVLQRQKRFRLEVNGVLVCTYVADFVYWRGGVRVVEDVKSVMTARLRDYQMKKKLMLAVYGIAITETVR